MRAEDYLHFVWGENNVSTQEQQTYIIKLDPPACSIRFNYEHGMFASFDEFYKEIADVQFLCGERPPKEHVAQILINAWNFMVLEEEQLDNDLADMEYD